MKTKELIEYLEGLDLEANVSALILNLETRQAYQISACQLMTDAGFPVMIFELGEASPMDELVEEEST